MPLRLVLGADSAGVAIKDAVFADLLGDCRVVEAVDIGIDRHDVRVADPSSRPDIGSVAARMIRNGQMDRALLVCGADPAMVTAAKESGLRVLTVCGSASVDRAGMAQDCRVLVVDPLALDLALVRRLVGEWIGHACRTTVAVPEGGLARD
ncbi:RpiB/LacA/LacB family sugar-phosphate isomerase [Kocuria sp. M1R5S2]|uniref:RpiB/LacA/LacB family sugar-phosphate isomerase n=1 Tax=Kocuria rhizosphaerae TaxID=3376285 RepID=UPI0037BD5BB4